MPWVGRNGGRVQFRLGLGDSCTGQSIVVRRVSEATVLPRSPNRGCACEKAPGVSRRGHPGRTRVDQRGKTQATYHDYAKATAALFPRGENLHAKDLERLVLGPLKPRLQPDGTSRIHSAYDDLMTLCLMVEEQAAALPAAAPHDLDAELRPKWQSHFARGRTLLKAVYVFADVFFTVLCREVLGPSKRRGVGFKGRLQEAPSIWTMATRQLTAAYAVAQFRNSLVVHHDNPRIPSATINLAKHLRLSPMGMRELTSAELNELWQLAHIYLRRPVGQTGNPPETVSLLFANVPPLYDGKINPDRERVDRFADALGIHSMTLHELLFAVDEFAVSFAQMMARPSPTTT